MSSKSDKENVLVVESIVTVMNQMHINQYISELIEVTKLIQTIFSYPSSGDQSLISVIENLSTDKKLVENNGTLQLIPPTFIEKEILLLTDFDKLLFQVDNEDKNLEEQDSNFKVPFFQGSNNSTLLRIENIQMFLEYLFKIKNPLISDRLRVTLFVLIAEEYIQMLKEKDIFSLTILGQQTVMTIVTKVYDRIATIKSLQELPKGPISHEIMRFFFVIKQLVKR